MGYGITRSIYYAPFTSERCVIRLLGLMYDDMATSI
jgi:hypothetical protein